MDILCYSVPKVCFPRYDYTFKHARPHWRRYETLNRNFCLKNELPLPMFGDVNVFYLRKKNSSSQTSLSVASKDAHKVECSKVSQGEYLRAIEGSKHHGAIIFVASYEVLCENENELELASSRIQLIEKGEYKGQRVRGKQKCTISSAEELPKHIDQHLERLVVKTLFERIHVLECLLDMKDFNAMTCTVKHSGSEEQVDLGRQLRTRFVRKKNGLDRLLRLYWECKLEAANKYIGEQFGSVSVEVRSTLIKTLANRKQSAGYLSDEEMINFISIHSQGEFSSNELRDFFRNDKHDVQHIYDLVSEEVHLKEAFNELVENVNAKKSTVEQLYGEMRGIVCRSSMPPKEIPKFCIEMNTVLSEEDAKEILSVYGVTSVGYRFRTLEIFMDQKLKYKDKQATEHTLKHMLEKRKISKYTFLCEQKQQTLFGEVGSTVKIKKSATLGGFAKLGPRDETCILLAGHFAKQGPSVFIRNVDGEFTLFAHVLPVRNQTETKIDIAMAKVMPCESQRCQLQFKDENGNHRPSTLCLFDNVHSLSGLPVHIWGSSSQPGYGVIVSASHYIAGTDIIPYVKIEDREPEDNEEIIRFARLGDSGSIVCADSIDGTTVHVIAMLSGSPNIRSIDPSMKQHYTALRLNLGLNQLRREQQTDINLY